MDGPLEAISDYPTAIQGKTLADHIEHMHVGLGHRVYKYLKPGITYEVCLGEVGSAPSPKGDDLTRYTIPITITEKPLG